jgi:hypothetical protein
VRSGCRGCLSTLVGVLAIGVLVAGAAWGVMRMLETPALEPVRYAPSDGVRAQQKILDLARRRTRPGGVVLTEAELNAFVSRHLEPADLPLEHPVIRLRGDDVVEIAGTLPLARLLHESPLGSLADALPAGWLARPVWLTVLARTTVGTEPRRVLRLDMQRVTIGRQRVPAIILRVVLDPSSLRFTRIGLPTEVHSVRVEPGRLLIEATSPPSRT